MLNTFPPRQLDISPHIYYHGRNACTYIYYVSMLHTVATKVVAVHKIKGMALASGYIHVYSYNVMMCPHKSMDSWSTHTLGARTVLSCLVCLCVCMSVTTLVSTSFIQVRYVRLSFRLFLIFNSWVFDKTFRSKVMA